MRSSPAARRRAARTPDPSSARRALGVEELARRGRPAQELLAAAEASRLEGEARGCEERLVRDRARDTAEARAERPEVERLLTVRVRHAEPAAEIHGGKRNAVPLREREREVEDALRVLDEERGVED